MGKSIISMVSKVFLLLLLLLVVMAVCGCDEPTPKPSSNYGPDGTNSNGNGGYATDTSPSGGRSTATPGPQSTYTPSTTDTEACDNVIMDAANAIQSNDPETFASLMAAETLSHVSGTPDLTTPMAQKIGDALENARVIRAEDEALVYETTIDGVTITFLMVKEDGAWKISGL